MSNTNDPTPPNDSTEPVQPPAQPLPDAAPQESVPPAGAPAQVPTSPDAQPTEAYPPAPDAAATQAYPGAPETAMYPPADYGTPPVGPTATDTRPKKLGWVALGLAVLGFLLAGASFLPLPGIALAFSGIAGLLLLVALVLGIVVLASKKQGGKGLGIGAVITSVIGGIVWVIGLVVAIAWTFAGAAISNAINATPTPEYSMSAEPSQSAPTDPSASAAPDASAGDTAGYLAAVRPQLLALFQEIEPTVTAEQLDQIYPDETLITIGESFARLTSAELDAARSQVITQLKSSSDGAFTDDQSGRFFDIIASSASQYLG